MEERVQNNILQAGRSFSWDPTPLKREMLIEADPNQVLYLLPLLAVFIVIAIIITIMTAIIYQCGMGCSQQGSEGVMWLRMSPRHCHCPVVSVCVCMQNFQNNWYQEEEFWQWLPPFMVKKIFSNLFMSPPMLLPQVALSEYLQHSWPDVLYALGLYYNTGVERKTLQVFYCKSPRHITEMHTAGCSCCLT